MSGGGGADPAVNSPDSPEELCKDQLYLWHCNVVYVSVFVLLFSHHEVGSF